MEDQDPIIKLEPTSTDKLIDKFTVAAILFLWIYTAINYSALPSVIPVHFNWNGEIDNYGSKNTLWLMPVIVTVVVALLSFIIRHPKFGEKQSLTFYNKKELTKEDIERNYRLTVGLLRQMQLVISVMLSIINIEILRCIKNQTGHSVIVPIWLPLFIVLLILPVLIFLYRYYNSSKQKTNMD
jgi:uncharacterized membrane protein